MREWTVGGALIEEAGSLLLVRNERRDGSHDWTPPGGVIDPGETLLEGLAREVLEETGLTVTSWDGPAYRVEVVAADLDWHLRVEAWRATTFDGSLVLDDPDGIVSDARFASIDECSMLLQTVHAWVREPVSEWLAERWEGTRSFRFQLDGADRASAVVTRHPLL